MKHLLSINDLNQIDAMAILDTAAELARVSEAPMKKLPTLRGRTIVNLFAEDSSVPQIAKRLCITVRTVETHRANLMKKLDLHSHSELVVYARKYGIIA